MNKAYAATQDSAPPIGAARRGRASAAEPAPAHAEEVLAAVQRVVVGPRPCRHRLGDDRLVTVERELEDPFAAGQRAEGAPQLARAGDRDLALERRPRVAQRGGVSNGSEAGEGGEHDGARVGREVEAEAVD